MTKTQILKELKMYGIEATLRPRKTILVELLERVRKEHKEGTLTSDVTVMDDIYYYDKKVTTYPALIQMTDTKGYSELEMSTGEWMEFTKVEPKWTWREYTVAAIVVIGAAQAIAIGTALVLNWVL